MDSVINSFFSTIKQGLIMPVADGLWGILPIAIVVAIGAAILGVVFSSSMQRGQKIASVAALIVLAVALNYLPQLVTAASQGQVDLSQAASQSASQAAEAVGGSAPAVQAAPTLSGLDPDSAEE